MPKAALHRLRQPRVNASLSASLGLSTSGSDLAYSMQNPSQSQAVNIGFTLPILDWGRARVITKWLSRALN